MAAFDTTRPTSMPARAFTGFAMRALSSVISWNDQRVTRKALGKLSARELEDIGLCRSDIDMIARRVS